MRERGGPQFFVVQEICVNSKIPVPLESLLTKVFRVAGLRGLGFQFLLWGYVNRQPQLQDFDLYGPNFDYPYPLIWKAIFRVLYFIRKLFELIWSLSSSCTLKMAPNSDILCIVSIKLLNTISPNHINLCIWIVTIWSLEKVGIYTMAFSKSYTSYSKVHCWMW